MFLVTGYPDFVVELAALLAFFVFECADRVQAWIELAHGLNMREHTIWSSAISAITAKWHRGMPEWATGVGAIGEEFTVLLGLVCNFLRW